MNEPNLAQETAAAPAGKEHAGERPVYILALETSCDETAASIVRDGTEILANVVSSQIETHQRFGGVVPEVASRKHVESITWILQEALDQAQLHPSQLSAVAVTQGPGLVGALLVGMVAAKAFACAWGLPLIGVHHIAGHIYANALVHQLQYPFLSLVVSGGHTELVYVESEGRFRIIGQTRDDAAGEAYDKVARALKLPYPGGPHIDRLALESEEALTLPRAWLEPDSYDFSFSGLKSAVLAALNSAAMKGQTLAPGAVAKGFQDSVTEVLVEKALRAVKAYGAKQLLLAGGVAANKGLRARLEARCAKEGVPLLAPPHALCTDNAAMIAAAAFLKYRRAQFASLDMKADPQLKLEEWSV
ncbi:MULTISPECIES: tRNA (adenosine(37)-N6)-threonylcarbamoyltransferase complex transferase subunit TsaD [Paenibacillus]|uniref:tRNA (adenosine(37)-N6)-threonylcarbamoyltransferase complex transferase subunit TsaD n=1 Tax=Paenibacillus TaxID=44249 RepID=UPI0022B8AE78|nr:tRNA (adenosine(37)-N6)-threonylcarbamoyltransferase complex transferase subunit TsaD [Paenibacillus caseinilyticus]MCZ8524014.1 tRNA (adenosine(37)-N6)-threonylcarbamoyltransferase complex transferase subunit TsaD [Paenibacillus caseinilyticus]